MNAHLHGPGFPGIVTFLAADAATGQLHRLGLPSPVNQWGARVPAS